MRLNLEELTHQGRNNFSKDLQQLKTDERSVRGWILTTVNASHNTNKMTLLNPFSNANILRLYLTSMFYIHEVRAMCLNTAFRYDLLNMLTRNIFGFFSARKKNRSLSRNHKPCVKESQAFVKKVICVSEVCKQTAEIKSPFPVH